MILKSKMIFAFRFVFRFFCLRFMGKGRICEKRMQCELNKKNV